MFSVAIDGPAGAGKSTVARAAALRTGMIYVDTGALYRAIALHMLQAKIDPADALQVVPALSAIKVELSYVEGRQRVFLNGEDVSEKIRTPEVSMATSAVSAIPQVREYLMETQRGMAEKYHVVMDGRDIGTVVLPNAPLKIFLTASPEVRAKRRYEELSAKGAPQNYEQVLAEVIQRDYNDSHRKAAPLKQAEDAVLLDTSNLTLEQSIAELVELIHNRRMETQQ